MSKYIPKVGETFEWRWGSPDTWEKCGAVLARTEKAIAYPSGTGYINTVSTEYCEFRPIPTKADVEREQLQDIIYGQITSSLPAAGAAARAAARDIQKAGFTIPKKISFSDLYQSMVGYGINHNLEQWWESQGKELLGDLVESDND